MMHAIGATRPGGRVGYVGVSHRAELDGMDLFFATVNLLGGPTPVRRFPSELIQLIMSDAIDPVVVFDLTLPLDWAAEGEGRAPRHEGSPDPLMPAAPSAVVVKMAASEHRSCGTHRSP